jgi:glucosamine--fructose-6-phosphate aminotransferase (isomerizing)
MLKEIFEQPNTLKDCIRGRITPDGERVVLSGVLDNKEKFLNAKRVIIVACGTSWHAALIGKRLIQEMCKMPVEVEYASEFRYGSPFITTDDIVISISQSGETADTLAAIQLARSKGAFVYGICNVVGASIPRNTDSGTYIHVGPEIGVASTKAFTGQVTVLTLLALCVAQLRGTIEQETVRSITAELQRMPEIIKEVLKLDDQIKQLSHVYTYAHNFLYLGRGYNYPTALEGALKLKEISYIHAEGYPAAEMKHGPIALIDNEMPTVIIAPSDSLYDKIISNVQQVKSRGGSVVAIVSEGNTKMKDLADFTIEVPRVQECLTPIVTSIPLQLLAYYIAVYKGRDVDRPRNLAKSVTVE